MKKKMVFQRENFLFLAFLLVLKVVECEKPFKSIPVTVKAYENDTALLPCYLDGMDRETSHRVRWYKDDKLIGDSADAHLLLPKRTRMLENSSLEIYGLTANDTADYTCEIVRVDKNPLRQMHSIEVQYAPTVKTIPEDGYQEVRKGDYVDIGCEVHGTPTPIVDWRKNGESLAPLMHRSRLRFKADQRHLAGIYECVANNGVGDPVTAPITVVIHDAPEVSAVRSFVHSALGLRASLAAKLHFAAPPAHISWYKEGRPVKTDDRVVLSVQDNIHELIIRSVRRTDFGNYTFRAENSLGMADVSFRLTGVPDIASFKLDPARSRATATTYTLVWEVDSYSTIIEYNLWLRPYVARLSEESTDNPNLWSKIVVPGDSADGPIHAATYTVRGLTPSTVYEAMVSSRNNFGWSKVSPVLHFATEPAAYRVKPSTTDYNELETPILEDFKEVLNTPEQNQLTESGARENQAAIFVLIISLKCILVI